MKFAIPKALAKIKYFLSKTKVILICHQTNTNFIALSQKCMANQTFFSLISISNKSQQSKLAETKIKTMYSKKLLLLIALVNTQSQEITSLKNIITLQSNEIFDIRKPVKKLSINIVLVLANSTTSESIASYFESLYTSKLTPNNLKDNVKMISKPNQSSFSIMSDIS